MARAAESNTAVVRFRHEADGSGISRTGQVRPGGKLVVVYDPARLPPDAEAPVGNWDIICHVQFRPGGQHQAASVLDASASPAGAAASTRSAPITIRVPLDASEVALWFEGRGPSGTIGWDSRYGQNYTFAVMREGLAVPEPSVAVRPGTIVDPSHIRVVEDAAAKEKTILGRAGKRLRTELVVRALVADTAAPIDAWADIHVFDSAEELIQSSTVSLTRREATEAGTLFVWEDDIYQGSGGGSGVGVWSRPDAHTIQYRLYCSEHRAADESPAQVFTDGILHEFDLPADEDVGDVPHS